MECAAARGRARALAYTLPVDRDVCTDQSGGRSD
eukprot:SAG31_NODE_31880_length_363_cov_0.541667_1_plen_33_part_01